MAAVVARADDEEVGDLAELADVKDHDVVRLQLVRDAGGMLGDGSRCDRGPPGCVSGGESPPKKQFYRRAWGVSSRAERR